MFTKTKKPSKQRRRQKDLHLSLKRKNVSSPLDKVLSKKIGIKRIAIRKGDTVKIMVGDNKGKTGKVEKVNYDKGRVYLKEIKVKNARGQEKAIPFVPSNLMITEAVMEDTKRISKKNIKKELNKK